MCGHHTTKGRNHCHSAGIQLWERCQGKTGWSCSSGDGGGPRAAEGLWALREACGVREALPKAGHWEGTTPRRQGPLWAAARWWAFQARAQLEPQRSGHGGPRTPTGASPQGRQAEEGPSLQPSSSTPVPTARLLSPQHGSEPGGRVPPDQLPGPLWGSPGPPALRPGSTRCLASCLEREGRRAGPRGPPEPELVVGSIPRSRGVVAEPTVHHPRRAQNGLCWSEASADGTSH